MSHDNIKTLENGFAKGVRMIEDVIFNSLADAADKLLVRASTNRQFRGFTGNTQTSYACGLYQYGKLVHVSVQRNWNEPPRRIKIAKGKSVYLKNPYEGHARKITGKADVTEEYGIELSLKYLQEYKAPKKGIALVMTTGTEYSEYIEQSLNLDVLTNTYKDALSIINSSWKKINE